MVVYTFTEYNAWDGREIVSVHLTKKGALLDAINNMCLEMLACQEEESDLLEKEEIEYIEEWYAKLQSDKPVSITELEKVLDYTSERYWHLEREVFIHEHTIKV